MHTGTVFVVGAGPGDPDLLTLKAARVLRAADVVLHDHLVGPEILKLVPARARLVAVGKRCGAESTPQEEINRLLLEYSLLGLQVVRLKGGDPFIFGRGGEEMEVLRAAGIRVEVVPGITAAMGAAGSAQIPLTHRDVSSSLILVTGSSKRPDHVANWPDRLPSNATVVVYMPGHDLSSLRERLMQSGVDGNTPCAIVSSANSESEQIYTTTVRDLAEAPHLRAPRIVIIGAVVRLMDPARMREWIPMLSDEATRFEPRENGK